jgi:acetyl-CoA C-acetyltransferase
MPETAENLANEYSISRQDSDAFAVRSHQNAAAAWAEGRFTQEVIPVTVPQRKGPAVSFSVDEGIRADTSLQALAKLRPLLDGGTVTAGNASQQNDAAAACLVVGEDRLDALDLIPMAFLKGWAAAGCHPATMGIGPVPAVKALMARTGLSLEQMDLIELNEAFAAQVLAVLKAWNFQDMARLNVNGGGISLGHPIGATGVRILTTLLHEMQRRQVRFGLETMCIGGGQGLAAIFERAS